MHPEAPTGTEGRSLFQPAPWHVCGGRGPGLGPQFSKHRDCLMPDTGAGNVKREADESSWNLGSTCSPSLGPEWESLSRGPSSGHHGPWCAAWSRVPPVGARMSECERMGLETRGGTWRSVGRPQGRCPVATGWGLLITEEGSRRYQHSWKLTKWYFKSYPSKRVITLFLSRSPVHAVNSAVRMSSPCDWRRPWKFLPAERFLSLRVRRNPRTES